MISYYELLGLVKDGKAPKKIKWNDLIYEKSKYNAIPIGYYYRINGGIKLWLIDEINSLNDEVEIIEEEKKIPEKLETYKEVDDEDCYANILKVSKDGECEIDEATSVIVDKINSIIDYLQSKGE